MDSKIMDTVSKDFIKKRPDVQVGDTVKLHLRIKEGSKERIQIFEGIVLALKGKGLDRTITVRKMSYGIGVEKIVPLHASILEKVEIVKRGKVRRSKLYFMRDKVGKQAMNIAGSEMVYYTDEVAAEETAVQEGEAADAEASASPDSAESAGEAADV